jgi:hypothetical protein
LKILIMQFSPVKHLSFHRCAKIMRLEHRIFKDMWDFPSSGSPMRGSSSLSVCW